MSSAMNSAPRIRVLLVDSDFIVRCGVAVALQREPDFEIIAQVSDQQRAREVMASHAAPDVLLMGMDSSFNVEAESERAAVSLAKLTRTLVYGGDETEEQVFNAVDAGACGYLCHHTRRSVFVDAVRSVAAGRRYFSARVKEMLSERHSRKELSVKEVGVLHLIAEGLSNKEMASRLSVSPETVKFHVGNVIEKLGARDRTHALVMALRRGVMKLPRPASSLLAAPL